MLVLRRACGETIVIAGTITVTILAIEGDRLKIGVTAPPEVTIVRGELLPAPTSAPGSAEPVPDAPRAPRAPRAPMPRSPIPKTPRPAHPPMSPRPRPRRPNGKP